MSNQLAKDQIAAKFTDQYKPSHQNGPDYEIPTEEIRSWMANGVVKLHTKPPLPTMSVVTLFHNTVKKYPQRLALVSKRDGQKVKWTYKQYWDDVRTAAKGFIKLGLVRFHGVCILGFNSPKWLIAHLATIFAGGLPVGIYTSNSPAACLHVLDNCDANIVVVENEKQLQKVLEIRDSLTHLKAIIQYTGTSTHPDVITWTDLLLIGQSVSEDVLEIRIKSLATNQCCCLIYTSGTTGNSKGVMLSHDNIQMYVNYVMEVFYPHDGKEHAGISYLPLSHLAALGGDVYGAIHYGTTAYFGNPDILRGKMIDFLKEVKPSLFMAVPRIVEKMYEKMQQAETSMNWFSKLILSWAKNQALKYYKEDIHNSTSTPFMFTLAKKLVLSRVKTAMGFQNLEYFGCGGAPIAPEIKNYFMSLDLYISEGYGLSESTAPGTVTAKQLKFYNFDNVGNINSIKDYEMKILNPDEDGNGEILIYGRNVCMGYLKLEKETKELIDDDRWLYSGDMGKIDEYGNLYITGRIKELVVTAGGENIPPLYIEDAIKKNLPVVGNCMLIGDKRKYLTVLITLKTELDMDTLLQSDKLTKDAISWCESIGSDAKSVSEILKSNDPKVMEAIQVGITKYNEKSAISNAQKVQKFTILPEDFSIGNGDLGPTGKLRRPIIVKKYSEAIEKMY